ncbi:MAG: 3D domain-containing protein [bacterium]
MRKIFAFLLMVALTGIISEPEASPQTGIETISVTSMKKVDLPRPFFRLVEKQVLATAYTSVEGNLTFTETKPERGTIAVDPEYIELGSIVYFPDLFPGQKFLAVDTGKKIKGWKVDIWLPSVDIANEFGKKKLRAIIQKPLAG